MTGLRDGKKLDPETRFVIVAPLVGFALLMAVSAHGPWSGRRAAGAILIVGFLGLLTVARLELGNSFSVTPQAKTLVTSGIYSKIRHPVYVFSTGLIASCALYFAFPWLLLLVPIIVPVQILRARREEAVLTAKFGEAYTQYRARTWF